MVVSTKFRSKDGYARNYTGDWSQVAYIAEVPGYLFYHCMISRVQYKVLYDKAENKKFEIDMKENLKDDICGGPAITFGMNAATEGKFISSVEALTLKSYIAGNDFTGSKVLNQKKKDDLKKLADSLGETDNPF